MRIFVSIASYKDSELLPTIQSVLFKASNINNITLGICQQDIHSKFLHLVDFIKIKHFDYKDSKGVGWARKEANSLYSGEDIFVQLDSHMEMVENWDEKITSMWKWAKEKTNGKKVIFAGYPADYQLDANGNRVLGDPGTSRSWPVAERSKEIHFLSGKAATFKSEYPIPALFLNAGFMFGDGSFLKECPEDEDIYFWGEEIINTLQAFTRGYCMFHPNEHICWHYYGRKDADRHWNDDVIRKIKSSDKDLISLQKVNNILLGKLPGYLGNVRSIKDYEKYIKMDLRNMNPLIMDEEI